MKLSECAAVEVKDFCFKADILYKTNSSNSSFVWIIFKPILVLWSGSSVQITMSSTYQNCIPQKPPSLEVNVKISIETFKQNWEFKL